VALIGTLCCQSGSPDSVKYDRLRRWYWRGWLVDDAIVVVENTVRKPKRMEGTLLGAAACGTSTRFSIRLVISDHGRTLRRRCISKSAISFLPGQAGVSFTNIRLCAAFAVTLLVRSYWRLTLTPVCLRFMDPGKTCRPMRASAPSGHGAQL